MKAGCFDFGRAFAVAMAVFSSAMPTMAAEFGSSVPAIPAEATNLTQAAGRYLATVEYLHVIKGTVCGYALKRELPSYESVVVDEVVPKFPAQQRDEMRAAAFGLKPDMTRQGGAMFNNFYRHYTVDEQQDGKTACGFVVGSAITTRKIMLELFQRKAAQPN